VSILTLDLVRRLIFLARFGHFVFAPAAGLRSLLPPLRGSWRFPKFFDWIMVNAARTTFIPEYDTLSCFIASYLP
jgi:hypothetical protein